MEAMERDVLIGTDAGLWRLGANGPVAIDALADRPITAMARDGDRTWVLADGRTLWLQEEAGQRWATAAAAETRPATCLAPTPAGLLVGTEQAHLLKLTGGGLEPVTAFDTVEGREAWYTPWGDPADVRSISADRSGVIYVNVHVGGVVRSADGGQTWMPTVDMEVDVHQVLAHPVRLGVVLVAAAVGLGVSLDAGATWQFMTEGLHARYMRAVAIAGDTVLGTASTGPGGRQAAVYRRALEGPGPFARCRGGLPEWFRGNVDSACLAADGAVAIFGTVDGQVFRSVDAGVSWELVAKGLSAIRCVGLG